MLRSGNVTNVRSGSTRPLLGSALGFLPFLHKDQRMNTAVELLAAKLARLPPERIAEVVDFVDFIAEREHERSLVRMIQTASEASLAELWNNDADAAYDRL